jgi:release factor H-coupled RctB family protein
MTIQHKNAKVSVIAAADTWMEGETIRQLEQTATLPGMLRCVAMPDAQPGKGSPSGAAFVADRLYPFLVGSDAGCGMALWRTDFPVKKAIPARLAKLMDGLDRAWDGDVAAFLAERGVATTSYDSSLGTPGFSNHFIELQMIETIHDRAAVTALGLSEDDLFILVHSGSRGFGEALFMDYAARYGATGIAADSAEANAYLAAHDHAVAWAGANRDLCAQRTLTALKASGERVLDICHNAVVSYALDSQCGCWLHRKGAAPADRGPIVIPGSRDDLSFLVIPTVSETSLASLAHGAGRKIARGTAQGKLQNYYDKNKLTRNRWGGQVVCGDKALLWEEAGPCYKDAQNVVATLADDGLIEIVASFRPLVTFKQSEGVKQAQDDRRQKRQRERAEERKLKHRSRG